jgi:hypothetical protein
MKKGFKYSHLHFLVGPHTLNAAHFSACKSFQHNELSFEGQRQKMLARTWCSLHLKRKKRNYDISILFYLLFILWIHLAFHKGKTQKTQKMREKITRYAHTTRIVVQIFEKITRYIHTTKIFVWQFKEATRLRIYNYAKTKCGKTKTRDNFDTRQHIPVAHARIL